MKLTMDKITEHELKIALLGIAIGSILTLQSLWYLRLIGVPLLLFSLYRLWTCIEITEVKENE